MRWSVEFTARGYVLLSAELAGCLFPQDSLVALLRDGELWLLPTRGPAGGGLLLKQRNPAGDRSVLIHEIVPNAPVGSHPAVWDDANGALRIHLELTHV